MIYTSPENEESLKGNHVTYLDCPIKMICLCSIKYNPRNSDCELVNYLENGNTSKAFSIIRQAMSEFSNYSRTHH